MSYREKYFFFQDYFWTSQRLPLRWQSNLKVKHEYYKTHLFLKLTEKFSLDKVEAMRTSGNMVRVVVW